MTTRQFSSQQPVQSQHLVPHYPQQQQAQPYPWVPGGSGPWGPPWGQVHQGPYPMPYAVYGQGPSGGLLPAPGGQTPHPVRPGGQAIGGQTVVPGGGQASA
jgi:hypothetical protein